MLEITLRTEIKDKNGHNLTHSLAQQDFFICTTFLIYKKALITQGLFVCF